MLEEQHLNDGVSGILMPYHAKAYGKSVRFEILGEASFRFRISGRTERILFRKGKGRSSKKIAFGVKRHTKISLWEIKGRYLSPD